MSGKIITITSRKGGVGKTTTLLNLAGIYSNLQKKTLILDLDLYSNSVSISLNINNNHTIYNLIIDIMNNKLTEFSDYIVKYNEYISVLASIKDPRNASKIDLKYIEQIINMAKHYYDVILIDTSHVLIDLNIVIYDNTDIILNVLSNDPIDITNTKTFVNIVNDVDFADFRILLNESVSLEEKYFTNYDIRNFIGKNLNYKLPTSYYVKTIDRYVLDGKIYTIVNKNKKCVELYSKIALDLLEDKKRT